MHTLAHCAWLGVIVVMVGGGREAQMKGVEIISCKTANNSLKQTQETETNLFKYTFLFGRRKVKTVLD